VVALLTARRDRVTARELTSNVWTGGRFCPQNWLPRQRSPRDRKTKFSSFIYSHGQDHTISENWTKIDPVDVETFGLTEIVKNVI